MKKEEKDWSGFADDFDKLQEQVVGKEVMAELKNEFNKINKLGYLLELGCGNGTYTKLIEHAAEKIKATDYSEEMIKSARRKLSEYKKIEIQQADCYNLEYSDSTFDSVMMANLIHIIDDPEKALQESFRVLKPKGKIIITSFTMNGMSFLNKLRMMIKYLRVLGKPPANGTRFNENSLKDFVQKK